MGGSRTPCLNHLVVSWSSLAVALSVCGFVGEGEGRVAPYPAAQCCGCRSRRLWLIQD